MLRVKLSVFSIAWLMIGATMLLGCASNPEDKTDSLSVSKLYTEAKDEMSNGQWERAIRLLEKLESRAAGTPLAQQAQLDKAYSQYKSSDQVQASATLERFIRLNPANPALDYAFYLKGLVNFHEDLGLLSSVIGQDLAERDPKASKESFDAFKELVTRFPESRYSVDARYRMNFIVSSLAQYEVHVARYYFRRGAYLAALNRAQQSISDYRDVPATEEALYIIYKSYEALGMAQLRDDALRILDKNFPQSELIARGFKSKNDPWWKAW